MVRILRLTVLMTFLAGCSAPEQQKKTSVRTAKNQRCKRIFDIIEAASDRYKVDRCLLLALIDVESGFKPSARSHAGAMGLMQLMPATARHYGIKNPYNPVLNIFGGTLILRRLLNVFDNREFYAVAAYNSGRKPALAAYKRRKKPSNIDYVHKIMSVRERYQQYDCQCLQ